MKLHELYKRTDPKTDMLNSALAALHKRASSKGSLQNLNGYAFDIVRSYNLDMSARQLARLYKERQNISEGYKLQLERDAGMMVLNITDTATGKRTEVRGKSGYETNGYDKNDKLHQLLDKISKTANISELMNGEVVGINPKHPDGASAKAATTQAFNEAFDNPYKFKVTENNNNRWQAQALTDNNVIISFLASNVDTGWGIDFKTADADTPNNTTYDLTGKGDGQRTMTTVLAMLKQFIQDHSPKEIYFDAAKDAGNSRTNLYQKIVQRFAGGLGYTVDVQDAGSRDDFTLVKKVQENFADGKVKGKSRPGRVKRSGASCNGSVTELRKKAKNASGEKAKMYHWCANMKSGRQKK